MGKVSDMFGGIVRFNGGLRLTFLQASHLRNAVLKD